MKIKVFYLKSFFLKMWFYKYIKIQIIYGGLMYKFSNNKRDRCLKEGVVIVGYLWDQET